MNRILVANRGEIALRIGRACRDMGVRWIQAYSEIDRDSLPVRLADDAICIGGAPARQSYLNQEALIGAAKMTNVTGVHPGYGFLSENAEFAERCEAAGLTYIGPQHGMIRLMGDKAAARKFAVESGVPVSGGSDNPVESYEEALALAQRVGYPVLVKAVAGGGGRGMRIVTDDAGLKESLERAAAEAASSFGSGALYLEKYVYPVRHIEVQVLGDGERVVHLGERDCTIQRRHQKLLEEGPSPALSPELRGRILKSALALAQRAQYRSAGTLEFIVDTQNEAFYFIEMNTRIQVEHPVTEMLTGVDLVKLQLAVAAGERLPLRQDDVKFSGHAIECRINAEDPERGFIPKPGTLTDYHPPSGPGVRVDSHAYPGYALPPHYDSLIAKLIVWGSDRDEALARMRRALGEYRIEGVPTTLGFHRRLLQEPDFVASRVHTRYVRETMWAGHPMQGML